MEQGEETQNHRIIKERQCRGRIFPGTAVYLRIFMAAGKGEKPMEF